MKLIITSMITVVIWGLIAIPTPKPRIEGSPAIAPIPFISAPKPIKLADVVAIAPLATNTQQSAQAQSTAQISVSEAAAKAFIYQHESGNDTTSVNKNSGACGLGQALPCSKMPCSMTDYGCQDSFFTEYMQGRYGSWINAYNFWQSHCWW
jgi:hypothetical protein